MKVAPVVQDVVLVGGGHSHVIFMRMWAMQPIPGVRLTLVSEKVDTPYSGMLPGLIAGHYSPEDVHIDLARLCSWANVRFIERRVDGIDLTSKTITVSDDRPPIEFDVLSLDTGSTPELKVSGSDQFSVPVKPVHGFYARWLSILERIGHHRDSGKKPQKVSVGVVGSGAGGFELIMAMRHALHSEVADCHWFVRGKRALKGRPEKVSDLAISRAEKIGVVVHRGFDVVDVGPNELHAGDGRRVTLDEIIWCAAAQAPDWPRDAGLDVDARGFVYTNEFLQSVSHHFVFATGDIGTQKKTPSTKAGVFAVRQAPVLFQNIRRYLLAKPLKVYRPQSDFLSLMATGGKHAIGNRGAVTVHGGWVWRWKNAIDQKFMDRFRKLPEMHQVRQKSSVGVIPEVLLGQSSMNAEEASDTAMRCRGCGGKVGGSILDSVLQELQVVQSPGVLAGLDIAGDAAIIDTSVDGHLIGGLSTNKTSTIKTSTNETSADETGTNATEPGGTGTDLSSESNTLMKGAMRLAQSPLIQSVDQISAVCDDPYAFGRIAAVHALSDVVAAGAIPHSGQVIVTLPFADKRIVKRDLKQLMAGVVDALNADACALIGGHTAEGPELTLGFVVNGFMRTELFNRDYRYHDKHHYPVDHQVADHHTSQQGKPVAGDVLVLTKPLGTGVLLAGMMQQLASGKDVQAVLKQMQCSNTSAAGVLYENNVTAVTDVTGFGLLGHLHRLFARAGVGAQLELPLVAFYDGAIELAQQGIKSTLLEQNQQVLASVDVIESTKAELKDVWMNLLCDPQTSGGLLSVVPATSADAVLTSLRNSGCEAACVIGTINDSTRIQVKV